MQQLLILLKICTGDEGNPSAQSFHYLVTAYHSYEAPDCMIVGDDSLEIHLSSVSQKML